MKVYNINTLPEPFIWKDSSGFITKYLGLASGSKKLYVNIDQVPPDTYSTKYHSHSQQEEFFLILKGSGLLRMNHQEYMVKEGDFVSKPAGRNLAHTFFNNGKEMLVLMDVGSVEAEDTCYYPDEDIYLQKSNGTRRVFTGKALTDTWNSTPNKK